MLMRSILTYFFVVAFCFVSTGYLQAQQRYTDEISDGVTVGTFTYATKNGENLDLDVYMPESDPTFDRALIIYMHGGGFSEGSRNDKGIPEFCSKLARLGYVSVSISYRLTRKDTPTGFGCDCLANDKLYTFDQAVEDLQDATYFLIEQREQFGIDPHKIILIGSSAGAETALNTAYQPPYCYGLDSGPVSYAGVVAMAGAIPDLEKIYAESAVPSLLFHGTCDELVPYATAPHRHCKEGQPGYLILHGSFDIAQKLQQLNKPFWLHTTCRAGHEMASVPMTKYFDIIKDFCYRFVIKGSKEQIRTVEKSEKKTSCEYESFKFCEK